MPHCWKSNVVVHTVAIPNIVFWSVHALLAEVCDDNGFLLKQCLQNPALKITAYELTDHFRSSITYLYII